MKSLEGETTLHTGLVRLSDANLSALPATVRTPRYERSALTPGIVHIGVGNFHRAHQAWYLHRLMDQGLSQDWGIIGAGVRPYDALMREKLLRQDCLTTLIELAPDETTLEVGAAMLDYLAVADGHGPLISQLSDPAIRIVSMTVTESGYYRQNGDFDAEHADIKHDLSAPQAPKTAFGAIVAALHARRSQGLGPITIQSCDNLQNNGDIARDTIVSLARLSNPDLAEWITDNCSFPNAMVDCIVPGTGPNELALAEDAGIQDLAPVTHEPFRHWVIEDAFCRGRPEWERVGVITTTNVSRFEAIKLRILNGGHQILANAGDLMGIETIAGAMRHTALGGLLEKVETNEIIPHVAPVPGFTPPEYLALVKQRFANPRIVDTTRRVAFDGMARHAGFILPSIKDRIAAGGATDGLAFVEALLARYYMGVRDDGSLIEPNAPDWNTLNARANAARDKPEIWLDAGTAYLEVAHNPAFRTAFAQWLRQIYADGVLATVNSYLHDAA